MPRAPVSGMVNGILARIVLCSIWPRLRGRTLAKAPPHRHLSEEEIRERITEDGGKIDFKDMVHEREGNADGARSESGLANGHGADASYIVHEREVSADEGSSQSVLANDPRSVISTRRPKSQPVLRTPKPNVVYSRP